MTQHFGPVAALEEAFSRRTSSRRIVLEAIVARPGHFSAEELHRALRHVSRATVYRTLSSLQQSGVLCRVITDDGAPRYQLGASRHHHHLLCVACGQVQDIAGCGVDAFVQGVAESFGYAPAGHRLEIYGRCAACQGRAD